jgi:hypothetical protein
LINKKNTIEKEFKIRNIDDTNEENNNDNKTKWLRISEVNDIKKILDLLKNSSEREQLLKKNLINFLLLERKSILSQPSATTNLSNNKNNINMDSNNMQIEQKDEQQKLIGNNPSASATTTSNNNNNNNNEVVKLSKRLNDTVPTSLKLLEDKGQEIEKTYLIKSESVFEEHIHNVGLEDDEDDDMDSFEYFTYSKSKKLFFL